MSMLFGNDRAPAPMAMPVAPSTDAASQAARDAAAQAAQAESMAAGRRSTIVGGMKIAEDEQAKRAQKKAARVALG